MAGALGALLGGWTRHVWAGLFAAVVLFLPPIALLPWFVLDDSVSRGYYGAITAGAPVGWHLADMAGLTALAAALAVGRHVRGPRVALLAGAGLAAIVTVAVATPVGLGAPCAAPPGGTFTGTQTGADGNLDFEHGNLSGWRTRARGNGGWRAFPGPGERPPGPGSDPNAIGNLVGPPQGRFAALSEGCRPGSRILYRDLKLDGRRELGFTLFYSSTKPLASPPTIDHGVGAANQQVRVDVMDPAAPVDSLAPQDVLATIFRTRPGDTVAFGPQPMSFDLSPWAGRTVRLRFAAVDNQAGLHAIVDDVRLDAAR
jgi:adhesin HecA-like repeat protein